MYIPVRLWLQLIFARLEPVHSHTEKLCMDHIKDPILVFGLLAKLATLVAGQSLLKISHVTLKNEGLSISFLRVFFLTSPLIYLIFMTSQSLFMRHFVPLPFLPLKSVSYVSSYFATFKSFNNINLAIMIGLIDMSLIFGLC